ncbi:HIT family protein [Actinorhabdospora filicis]|nr:HIT family protein [Actinorhabdospora filicis]
MTAELPGVPTPPPAKVPMDLAAYETRVRTGGCFICPIATGEERTHEVVYEDDDHIAFLGAYPTLLGHTLVCPKEHLTRVVADFTPAAYLAMQAVVHRVARAVETVVGAERMYVLSLGSMQGNAHVHWHLSPLPPGVPYREQQHHALMTENGILAWDRERAAALGAQIRDALGG